MLKDCADVVDLQLHPFEPLSKPMASLLFRSPTPGAVVLSAALPRDFHLAGLTQLQTVSLESTQVTDAGLKELAALKQLAELSLPSGVDGTGLKHLAAMNGLQTLHCSVETFVRAGV